MYYKVRVREIHYVDVYVEAEDTNEALEKAEQEYGEKLMEYNDMMEIEDTTFSVKKVMEE